ncbi:integrase core domain-containing protein [Streptomyces sp. NPDC059467]|uniref:integrase core domain-containing protein n=1 Tax=Streptomyces sp. NPDC059467 TaxID=3346844 RepID=UPI0036789C6A
MPWRASPEPSAGTCIGNLGTGVPGSEPRTGRSSPRCCRRCPARHRAGYISWSPRTPSRPCEREPRAGRPRTLTSIRRLVRDAKYPDPINEILSDAGITTTLTGVRMPRMNAIMERWVRTLRAELLDRTLIWNESHLRRALRAYERHDNQHRTHRSLNTATPLRALPQPLEPDRIDRLCIRRHDHLGGVIHEYRNAA